jgi:hypothetical protein
VGVGIVTIWKWRKALSVPQVNEGTARLYREYHPEKITKEAYAKMTATARTPEAREIQSALKRGLKAHPNTARALREAASQPKSAKHRKAIGRALKRYFRPESIRKQRGYKVWSHFQDHPQKRQDNPKHKYWTPAEERMLGTTFDSVIAATIGRSRDAVKKRRKQLGIPMSRHARLYFQRGRSRE